MNVYFRKYAFDIFSIQLENEEFCFWSNIKGGNEQTFKT